MAKSDRPESTRGLERLELHYHGTYYFVDAVNSFINSCPVGSRHFSDYFETAIAEYVKPFERWTALHTFACEFVSLFLEQDLLEKSSMDYTAHDNMCSAPSNAPAGIHTCSPAWLLAADLMDAYGLDSSPLVCHLDGWVKAPKNRSGKVVPGEAGPDFDAIDEAWALEVDREELLERLSEEIFYVLFGNRQFCANFNQYVSAYVGGCTPDWAGHVIDESGGVVLSATET